MKLARNVAWWPASVMMVVGVATTLLVSTEVAQSAERSDRAATASDRAVRTTGTSTAAQTRKEIRKKHKQMELKKKAPSLPQ
jgi:hypothetical protein